MLIGLEIQSESDWTLLQGTRPFDAETSPPKGDASFSQCSLEAFKAGCQLCRLHRYRFGFLPKFIRVSKTASHFLQEVFMRDWLIQNCLCTKILSFAQGKTTEAGHENHKRPLSICFVDLFSERDAVHYRHTDIGDDQVYSVRGQNLQCLGTIARAKYPASDAAVQLSHQVQEY